MTLEEIDNFLFNWVNEDPENRCAYFTAAEFKERYNPESVALYGNMGGNTNMLITSFAKALNEDNRVDYVIKNAIGLVNEVRGCIKNEEKTNIKVS